MENQEKDNFWMWIGAIIVATVILVFMLKSRENEVSGWNNGAYQQTKAEVDKQVEKQHVMRLK
jgi:hypothetical protein